MPRPPESLGRLLEAAPADEEGAWRTFIAEHTRLLMSVARTLGGDHDAAMDRFTYVLEQLRRDDYRRLRAFVNDGSARFTTWLVVAARRLCVDHDRRRYGRRADADAASDDAQEVRRIRRRVADLDAGGADIETLADGEAAAPDAGLVDEERRVRLTDVLAELSPTDQLLLRLRFEEGLTAAEIARLLHLPTQFHAYRRINALLPRLRERLRQLGIEGLER